MSSGAGRDQRLDVDYHASGARERKTGVVECFGVNGVFHVDEESYDDFMGRYAVRLAPLFADFAGVRDGQRVLDVGAGTGALTRELVARGADVAAVEPSPEFTRTLRSRFPEVKVYEAAAEELPFAADSFDTAMAQLVVAFMTDAGVAMRELARVAHRVAICMWGVEEVQMFAAIDRTARAVGASYAEPGARRYRKPQELYDLLVGAGLSDVETCELNVTAPYVDFEDFWRALGRRVGPTGAWLSRLDDHKLTLVHDELHRQLGSPDGAFELHGRAFGASAVRPS
jgi:SAM-dependent methyltransferase